MDDIKGVYNAFEEFFRKYAEKNGFEKKRKGNFTRKAGHCVQNINILDTKIKGQQAINIRISIGITYAEINMKVAELRFKEYDSKWATGAIDLGALSSPPDNLSRYLLPDTNVKELCEELFTRIENNASRFWNKTDSMEKLMQALIDDEKVVCSSTSGLGRPAWTSLAIACLIEPDKIKDVLEKYNVFFKKNMDDRTRDYLRKEYHLVVK